MFRPRAVARVGAACERRATADVRGVKESTEPTSAAHAPIGAETEVARRLIGDLPCVTCRYNLRHLSVLEVCPECGTPVRATVLAVVDPYATVLQPIRFPVLTGFGLLMWSAAAAGAAVLTWLMRTADVYSVLTGMEMRFGFAPAAGTALIVLSCVGAMVLVRPHARIPVWQSAAAVGGIASGLAAAYLYWRLHASYDPSHTRPFVESIKEPRAWLRLMIGACLIGAVLGLRPAARVLAARSLVLRMGRVDRQTMMAMAGALAVAALGDVIRLGAAYTGDTVGSILNTCGIVLIAIGSMTFTMGLFGVLVDCVRIARVIVKPTASIRDVVERPPS